MDKDSQKPDPVEDPDDKEEGPPPFNPDPRLITEFERGRRRIEQDRVKKA